MFCQKRKESVTRHSWNSKMQLCSLLFHQTSMRMSAPRYLITLETRYQGPANKIKPHIWDSNMLWDIWDSLSGSLGILLQQNYGLQYGNPDYMG